jgi:uroporphyrinogen-III synthase
VSRSLAGCRVLVTRERPGELASMLAARGATVVHVPLIRVVDADDGALERELARLDRYDWLVVTSPAGAERTAAGAAGAPHVRVAAVGTASAATMTRLSGRAVDVVPRTQHAAALLDALTAVVTSPQRFLIAQADRAADTLSAGLRREGHDVTTVVAYHTRLQVPPPGAVDGVDALLLASGSAAEAWAGAVGTDTPPIVVSIGPTTTAVARRSGLKVTATAADHSLDGLVTELEQIWDEQTIETSPVSLGGTDVRESDRIRRSK